MLNLAGLPSRKAPDGNFQSPDVVCQEMPNEFLKMLHGAQTLRLNALICQAQMDAAKACQHSLDVVVQALMKEWGCRASTGRHAPHLVVFPLRSLSHTRPLCNEICARYANTHERREKTTCCILKSVSAPVSETQ